MRIGHILFSLDAGGTERLALRLARYWSDYMHNFLAYQRGSGLLEHEASQIGSVQIAEMTRMGGAGPWFRAVLRFLKISRPDAVLIHGFGVHHVLAAFACRVQGIARIACTAGNMTPTSAAGRARWAGVILLSRLLGCPIASCSSAVERSLRDLRVGMPSGSRVIPNGIEVPNPELPQRATSLKNKRNVVGMVARLDTIKDHATLLKAFALLRRKNALAELWIIGDGPERGLLEGMASTLRVDQSVRFLGRQLDVFALLRKIDLFAFSTTIAEGFGIALTEAMIAGVPIVASDVPATREVLEGGKAGILVEAGNATAMYEAINEMMEDSGLAAKYAEAALLRVRREYSIENCAERWLMMISDRS